MKKILIGDILKIPLSNDKFVICKVLKPLFLIIYNKIFCNISESDLSRIEKEQALLYVDIFKYVYKRGKFEIIKNSNVTIEELSQIPIRFKQEIGHPELCTKIFNDDTFEKALPSQCLGLKGIYIWDEMGLKEIIEDKLAGKINKYEKLMDCELVKGIEIENAKRMITPWEGWNYQ